MEKPRPLSPITRLSISSLITLSERVSSLLKTKFDADIFNCLLTWNYLRLISMVHVESMLEDFKSNVGLEMSFEDVFNNGLLKTELRDNNFAPINAIENGEEKCNDDNAYSISCPITFVNNHASISEVRGLLDSSGGEHYIGLDCEWPPQFVCLPGEGNSFIHLLQ